MNKPEPPEDLWEKLSAIEAEISASPRPPGSFTTLEYAAQHKVSRRCANERLSKLRRAGKIDLRGQGHDHYWVIK